MFCVVVLYIVNLHLELLKAVSCRFYSLIERKYCVINDRFVSKIDVFCFAPPTYCLQEL